MLCWYEGRYNVEYLLNPVSRYDTPGHTLPVSSKDGIHWTKLAVAFETISVSLKNYKGPRSDCIPDDVFTVPNQRIVFLRYKQCYAGAVLLRYRP